MPGNMFDGVEAATMSDEFLGWVNTVYSGLNNRVGDVKLAKSAQHLQLGNSVAILKDAVHTLDGLSNIPEYTGAAAEVFKTQIADLRTKVTNLSDNVQNAEKLWNSIIDAHNSHLINISDDFYAVGSLIQEIQREQQAEHAKQHATGAAAESHAAPQTHSGAHR